MEKRGAGNLKGEWAGGKNTPPRSYVGWVGKKGARIVCGGRLFSFVCQIDEQDKRDK